jgi:hypothetical protein
MTLLVSVTLVEGGTWWMKPLASHQELIYILNTGYVDGTQIAAINFNLEGVSVIYDFALKDKGYEPFRIRGDSK